MGSSSRQQVAGGGWVGGGWLVQAPAGRQAVEPGSEEWLQWQRRSQLAGGCGGQAEGQAAVAGAGWAGNRRCNGRLAGWAKGGRWRHPASPARCCCCCCCWVGCCPQAIDEVTESFEASYCQLTDTQVAVSGGVRRDTGRPSRWMALSVGTSGARRCECPAHKACRHGSCGSLPDACLLRSSGGAQQAASCEVAGDLGPLPPFPFIPWRQVLPCSVVKLVRPPPLPFFCGRRCCAPR